MSSPASPTPFTRVNRLASQRRVHEAFGWFHLQEQQIMRWQAELVKVAAPPFGERARAEWLCDRFRELGLHDVHIDEAGNALAVRRASREEDRETVGCVLLSAHIDTVFPADTPIDVDLTGQRLTAPGACDNGAGVVGMLAVAAALQHAKVETDCDLVFAGNVGEEGEGDLRGIRHIYAHSPWRERITANVVLDGAGHEVAVTQALGSRRYLATISGPGGHSWTDAGALNPIVALCRAVARLSELQLSDLPRTTFNVGTIEGGTSVNAIPETATARFDMRSTDPEQLIRLEVELHRAIEDAVLDANRAASATGSKVRPLKLTMQKIGDRPAGQLRDDAVIMAALRAVDRHLGIRTEMRVASTDANLPLSLGIEAISIGAGGDGGRVHTRAEWYDSRGREQGLRRILLLLLTLMETDKLRQ
jgi:tripeptide aminopeptidase